MGFEELVGRIGGRFGRVEPRRRVRGFLLGLLAGLPRTNCWTIAEHAGDTTPDGMQHLLARASWDAALLQEDLRDYVVDHLGDGEAVLVVDETGDLKKGTTTVGVQRQYTGTAGRIENAQVGVYLVYAAGAGHAFLDRALYLPRSWTTDPARCQAAGIPDQVEFKTKPELARAMITRALDADVPAAWVAGDEVYGNDPKLRTALHHRGIGYVLAVACSHRVHTGAGPQRGDELAARLPARAWQRLSAGPGAKGHRVYDWAQVTITEPDAPGQHRLLIRRSLRTGELAFFRAYAPQPVPLTTLVKVSGRRWSVEESFQSGKGLTGLDEHQVRHWTPYHRWTILAMLAHAFLAITTAIERARGNPTDPDGLIPLTCNEIRRLFTTLLHKPLQRVEHLLHWSRWRRRHQARAKTSHYHRQQLNSQDHELRLEY